MPRTRAGTVAIVGRPNVGKSTLLNALLGEPIAITSRHPQTTRDRILGVVTTKTAQFAFLDTPGLRPAGGGRGSGARTKLDHRMNQQAKDAVAEADVVVLVTEAAPAPKPADLAILAELPAGKPVVLALNKIDRMTDKAALIAVLESHSAAFDFAALVPISARKKDGVLRVLAEVEKHLPKATPAYERDMLTDRPLRFFVAEFVREQVLRRTHDEVPHGVAVVVDRFDEAARVPHIELSIHVDREGHKKILVGKGGQMLKDIGTQARARVEALMGRQVMLKLWVRVTPEWYESEAKMRDMGYA